MRSSLVPLLVLSVAGPIGAAELRVTIGGQPGSLTLRDHVVDVEIDNRLATTRIEQVFVNQTDERLEGTYLFPVPPGATLQDFAMWVGGRKVVGAVVEKRRGRQIYESYKRVGRDPALLEHVESNLFQVQVFPILPRSEVRIALVHRQVLEHDAGACRYVYPIRSSAGAAVDVENFRMEVAVESRIPIRNVTAEGRPAEIEHRTDHRARIVFEARDEEIAEDLAVRIGLAGEADRIALVAHRPDPSADGTFLLVIAPSELGETEEIAAQEITFVVDTSGSMQGGKIEQARRALVYGISTLGPADRFNVVSFASAAVPFSTERVAATPGNKARAIEFVEDLAARGGTALGPALDQALAAETGQAEHLVVVLTDGKPTIGPTSRPDLLSAVAGKRSEATRIYTIGIGTPADFDRELLDALAFESGGTFLAVAPDQDLEVALSSFFDKVTFPVWSDLSLDFDGARIADLEPLRLPTLFRGTQLLIFGRYRAAGRFRVRLVGRQGTAPVEVTAEVDLPEEADDHPALPAVWAARRIESLLYEMRRTGTEPTEITDEIVALALEHRLATPYTSFIVLESEEEFRRWGLEPGTEGDPAIEADHDETDDDEDTAGQRVLGGEAGTDAASDSPFRGKSTSSAIGLGGGASGAFGGRFGGRANLVARGGGRGTQSAVDMALSWLARHQAADTGHWDADGFADRCQKNRCDGAGAADGDVYLTALSTLAFLGAGNTHASGRYKDNVRAALRFLRAAQTDEGRFGPAEGDHVIAHAVATLAVSEAYGMTRSPLLEGTVEKAIAYLLGCRTGTGWSRTGGPDPDTSTTGWAIMALKSARVAEIAVDRRAFEGGLAWIESMTDEASARTLERDGDAGVDGLEPATATSIISRILCGTDRGQPKLRAQADRLGQALPAWDATDGQRIDQRYWYAGTLAAFQMGGDTWKAWNAALKKALLPNQRQDGDERGSWDPIGRHRAAGGRIEATALAALDLEIYYRYERVFR